MPSWYSEIGCLHDRIETFMKLCPYEFSYLHCQPVCYITFYVRRRVKNYPPCRYMFCKWLHGWLGMTWYTWSTSLLPLWCRCGLDSLCRELHAINTDVLLFIGTKEGKRALICFLWAEGVPGAEMHRRMSVQYGNSVVSQQIVYKWVKRFRNGRTSAKHEEGTRHLSRSITDANTEQVCGMILQNRQVTIDEVAHQMEINHASAYAVTHNSVAFHKVSAWCVAKLLTELHQHKLLDICKLLLVHCVAEGDHFLERIITRDETWIHHYELESKRQSMEWTHPHLPTKRKFKCVQPQESLCW